MDNLFHFGVAFMAHFIEYLSILCMYHSIWGKKFNNVRYEVKNTRLIFDIHKQPEILSVEVICRKSHKFNLFGYKQGKFERSIITNYWELDKNSPNLKTRNILWICINFQELFITDKWMQFMSFIFSKKTCNSKHMCTLILWKKINQTTTFKTNLYFIFKEIYLQYSCLNNNSLPPHLTSNKRLYVHGLHQTGTSAYRDKNKSVIVEPQKSLAWWLIFPSTNNYDQKLVARSMIKVGTSCLDR